MMKRIYILAVALVLALMPAAAQDVSKQESRKAKLQREIELLDQQLAQNASRSSALLSSLDLLRKNSTDLRESREGRQILSPMLWFMTMDSLSRSLEV